MKEHKIVISGCESLWLLGSVDEYSFAAKVYDVDSIFGIDNGRVCKLSLSNGDEEVVNYDRGWDLYPSNTDLEDTMEALLRFLANIPEWENWYRIQRNKPYTISLPVRDRMEIPSVEDEEEEHDRTV